MPDDVDVWLVELTAGTQALRRLEGTLGDEERERAAAFVFERHRTRYVVAHGLLRRVLSLYAGLPAGTLRFKRARHGKPYLARGGPRFNLSHSGELALIAVAEAREVGVDVERTRAERDHVALASRFFSPAEAAALRALPEEERVRAFYRCWTRKEAYLKSCGTGLALRLDAFDVSLEPERPALLRSERGAGESDRWKFADVAVPAGYTAALAVEGDGWRLVRRSLDRR